MSIRTFPESRCKQIRPVDFGCALDWSIESTNSFSWERYTLRQQRAVCRSLRADNEMLSRIERQQHPRQRASETRRCGSPIATTISEKKERKKKPWMIRYGRQPEYRDVAYRMTPPCSCRFLAFLLCFYVRGISSKSIAEHGPLGECGWRDTRIGVTGSGGYDCSS